MAACGGDDGRAAPRTDVPEPAVSPPVAGTPPGRIVALAGEPEGLALDGRTGTLAVKLTGLPSTTVVGSMSTSGWSIGITLDWSSARS